MELELFKPKLIRLFKNHGVILAYLFGSRARNIANTLSDVDVAILFSERVPETEFSHRMVKINTELVGMFHINDVDVVILNSAPPLLSFQVVKNGLLIFDIEDKHVQFEIQTLNRYMDTKPLRNIQWNYFIKRQKLSKRENIWRRKANFRINLPRQSFSRIGYLECNNQRSVLLQKYTYRRTPRDEMIEIEVVKSILQTLNEYVEDLQSYQQLSEEEVIANRHNQSMIRYALQTAIQCVIDVGNHILTGGGFERPEDNKEAILGLGRHGVIPMVFAEKISGMAGFRNILVHRYFKVDAKLVYQNLQEGVDDFKQFSQYIMNYLEKVVPNTQF